MRDCSLAVCVQSASVVSSAYLTGWAARRGPGFMNPEPGPFPRSLPPNPAGAFQRTGLSSDYAVCVTGFAWMTSWQGWQTTRVLRRFLVMRAAHAGWPGPGAPSRASLATWWTSTTVPCPHSSHLRLRSRQISSLRGSGTGTGTGSAMIAVLDPHERYPAEPCYQVLLAVAGDPGLEARAQPVRCLDLGLVSGRHLGHRGLVLGRQRLQHRRLGVPAQRVEPPDVAGEQVVAGRRPGTRLRRSGRCRSRPGSAARDRCQGLPWRR